MTFGEQLRAYRRAAGYSQERLAERAGLSAGAIAALEQGIRRAPHRDTVAAISMALALPEPARERFEATAAQARHRPHRDGALPASLTSFVARDEVEELRNHLATHRLVTITGTGGVGKTRTAIEVARRATPDYDDIWFVDLLPVRDGSLVAARIAARLNVRARGDDGLGEIVQRLRSRRVLLVLDNCEQIAADATAVIERLLSRCVALTVLATSRRALGVAAELAYRLPSMDARAGCELFAERARNADPKWQPDARRLALVAEICRTLDGIPLAIELAASQVATIGLEALRARLGDGLGVASANRAAADRHQTMDATVAWSYAMLNEAEQATFRYLSVFVGGFTLEAALAICGEHSWGGDAVGDAVAQLARGSLLDLVHVGTSVRYRFLEPIRTFGWQRLRESGERHGAMGRFVAWLKQKAARLDADPPPQVLIDERVELDNVRFAIRWATSLAQQDATLSAAAEILIGFRNVWFGAGRQMEFRTLAFELLERLDERRRPDLVGLLVHAMAGFLTGPELLTLSERAIPLLVASGHGARAADLHARSASAECMRGDATSARNHLTAGDALLDANARRTRVGFSFASHGAYVHCLLNDFSAAKALLDGAVVRPGEPFEVDRQVLYALIEFRQGRVGRAIEILENAKPGLERHSNAKHLTILVAGNLAGYYLTLGNAEAARDELHEALAAAVEIRDLWLTTGIALLGRYAAYFAATCERAELAARLVGACDDAGNPASLEDDAESRDRAMEAIDARLAPERSAALRRRGAAEDLYELIEEYLAQPSAAETARASASSSPRATAMMRSSPN